MRHDGSFETGPEDASPRETAESQDDLTEKAAEEFGELVRYTLAGYIGGALLGFLLDHLGLSRSALGQWGVRTLSGEGESILEGLFAIRKRVAGSFGSLAEAYGWGKLLGMTAPWLVDGVSRVAGIDVYGIPGFYIPFFYAMSDQIGASVSGFAFIRRRSPDTVTALRSYLTHPVMIAGLAVVLAVPVGLALARIAGFSPTTQVLTALETIVANLCWVPPLIGWRHERKERPK